jgi:hypothetical protein
MSRRKQRQQGYQEDRDDHVIRNVEMVHIERLDEKTIWIGVYLFSGRRRVFQVVGTGDVRLSFNEEEWDDSRWQECPVCSRTVKLRTDGTFSMHRPARRTKGTTCRMTHRQPGEVDLIESKTEGT